MAALPLGAVALSKVPGVSTEILVAAGAAFQQSYVVGLRTTALSSLSFGIIAIIGKLALTRKFERNEACEEIADVCRSMHFLPGYWEEDGQEDRSLLRERCQCGEEQIPLNLNLIRG